MKITILLLLASICSYGQIDTTTVNNENFINLKNLDSFSIGLTMSKDEFKLLRFPTQEEQKKQYWRNEKEKLSKILGDYLGKTEKIIVGYRFIQTVDEYSYSAQEVYYADKKQYAPVNTESWIYNRFYNESDMIRYLKENIDRYRIEIDFDKIEPIYVDKEKTLQSFYEWLNR